MFILYMYIFSLTFNAKVLFKVLFLKDNDINKTSLLFYCYFSHLSKMGLSLDWLLICEDFFYCFILTLQYTIVKFYSLISCLSGITNTIGRVMSGWLADYSWVNSLLLHNIMMILGGVACILNMFATTYAAMCVFCAFFGLCVGEFLEMSI